MDLGKSRACVKCAHAPGSKLRVFPMIFEYARDEQSKKVKPETRGEEGSQIDETLIGGKEEEEEEDEEKEESS